MARIQTNISSLIAQRNLARSQGDLQTRLTRLSTGLRLNRGADDPAGLIVSERLRTEIAGIEQGIKNSERASGVIATAEGAMSEASDLLNSIKALVVEAANSGAISQEEKEANQLQIDSAIESITRIANSTSFAGLKLLDGSLSYLTSGIDGNAIAFQKINAVNFGTRDTVDIDVQVIASAQQASLYASTSLIPGITPGGGTTPSAVSLEIAGPEGVQVLEFASGVSLDAILDGINGVSDNTGIRAEYVDPANATSGLRFYSVEHGNSAFVSVQRLGNPGAFFSTVRLADSDPEPIDWTTATLIDAQRDQGRDVTAIVNGAVASGDGLQITVRTRALDLELFLTETFAQDVPSTPTTFTVTGGGALYQLGPQVKSSLQTNIGIQSLADSRLGGTLISLPGGGTELQFLNTLKSGGKNALLSGNFIEASKVLETAIDEVAVLRGRLGAFERNTLQTNVRSLGATLENVTAASSQIRDADFALETSEMTRAQVLTQAGTTVLATANAQLQNVLTLLG